MSNKQVLYRLDNLIVYTESKKHKEWMKNDYRFFVFVHTILVFLKLSQFPSFPYKLIKIRKSHNNLWFRTKPFFLVQVFEEFPSFAQNSFKNLSRFKTTQSQTCPAKSG